MFDKLIDFSLKNRAAVLFFTVLVAIWGWVSFKGLTIEAFPDPTDTQVQVITLFPGQPAEEVERQIGLPLERALNGTPGMNRLRNLSLFGLSFVTLTFNDGVDGLAARAQVLERLRDAELPEGITPELGPYATPIGEVYRYTLTGAKGDPMKLRTLQEWVVRPQLLRVNGVADVVSIGGLQREVHVQPDPARLAAFDLQLEDLEKAIKGGSMNASGGVLERGEATWSDDRLLIFERHGFTEEAYLTFSYSPIRVESGAVGGVFTVVSETTQKVVGERRLRVLRALSAQASEERTAEQAWARVLALLASAPQDVPFALLYGLEPQSASAHLRGRHGALPSAAAPETLSLESEQAPWPLAAAWEGPVEVALGALGAPWDGLPGGPWPEPARQALIVPLRRTGEPRPSGFLVAGTSPRLPLDAAYREALAHDGPALVDVVTDPNALSLPPKITSDQVFGFATAMSKIVLNGGAGEAVSMARSNLRNIPRR